MLLEVKSIRINYRLDIREKYVVISGDSGIGKTTLFSLVYDYGLGNRIIQLVCDKEVVAIITTKKTMTIT